MVGNDGAEVRKQRIADMTKHVLALLEEFGGEIPFEKTVSLLAYESGLTKEKVKEYLSIPEDLERFVLDVEKGKIRKVVAEEETSP